MLCRAFLHVLPIVWLISLECVGLGFAATEQEHSTPSPTLHILATYSPPITFLQDDRPTGFGVELVREIARRLNENVDITIRHANAKDGSSARSQLEAILPLLRTPERENLYKWVGPVLPKRIILYGLKDNVVGISSLDQAKRVSRIAAVTGSDAYRGLTNKGFSNLMASRSPAQCADDLKYGRAQLWLTDNITMLEAVRAVGLNPKDIVPVVTVMETASYIGFTLSSDDRIVNAWQRTLDEMKRDGTFDTLEQSWILDPTSPRDIGLTDEEKDFLAKHPVVHLGVDPLWPPFEFLSAEGEYEGMASQYMRLLSDMLGITMEVVPQPTWGDVIIAAKARDVDVLACAVKSPERDSYLDFTEPYLTFPMIILTRDDAPPLRGLKDLNGKRVAVITSFATEDILRSRHPSFEYINVDNLEEALRAVSTGQVFAFVGNIASTSYYIHKLGLTNIKVAAPTPYEFKLSLAVRNDWPEFIPIFNKALRAIPENRRDDIYRRWITLRFEHTVISRDTLLWVLPTVGALLLLLGVTLYWNRKLYLESRRREDTQHALFASEAHYRTLFENSPISLWEEDFSSAMAELAILEDAGIPNLHDYFDRNPDECKRIVACVTVRNVNQATVNLLGASSKEELLGRIDKVFVEESETVFLHELIHLYEGATLFTEQTVNRRLDGEIIDVYLNLSVPPGSHAFMDRVLVSLIDITKQKRMEEELNARIQEAEAEMMRREYVEAELLAAKEAADAANRAKSEFLAAMSHEIRTPLQTIIGAANTLCTKEAEVHEQALEELDTAAKHLLSVVDDVLDMAHVEVRDPLAATTDFDLHRLVRNIARAYLPKAALKQLLLHISLGPAVPRFVKGDPDSLRKALSCLLDNAVTYTESGRVELDVRGINHGPLPSGRFLVRFTVWDTGPGIDEGIQQQIRESFTQSDDVEVFSYGQTGLGLSICRRLAQNMGGSLDFTCLPGKGCRFRFSAAFLPGTKNKVDNDASPNDAPLLEGLRPLLVEDNEVNRHVTENYLKHMKADPIVACSATEAFELLAHDHFDVIIMDVQLDDIDGIEATRRIRRGEHGVLDPHIPILGLTAHALAEQRQAGLAAGMDDYLTKPVDFSVLAKRIKDVLSDRSQGKLSPSDVATSHLESGLLADVMQLGLVRLGRRLDSVEAALRSQNVELALMIIKEDIATLPSSGAARHLQDIKDALIDNDIQTSLQRIQQLRQVLLELENAPRGNTSVPFH